MKKENREYIIKEILPNDVDALWAYIRDQASMVFEKLLIVKDVDIESSSSVELEAMLLASVVQTGLIDYCLERKLDHVLKELEK